MTTNEREGFPHPLDNSDFRVWLRDVVGDEPEMAYGIYDSGWADLYDQYLDDIAAGEWICDA